MINFLPSNSMVECFPVKEVVLGSNPTRSDYLKYSDIVTTPAYPPADWV